MKEEIVIPAWEIASNTTEIKIFNFLPSLLSTVYLSLILLYQVAWSYINIFHLKDRFFSLVITFVHADYFMEVLIGLFAFFIAYLLITPISEGGIIAIIDSVDHKNPDEQNLIQR